MEKQHPVLVEMIRSGILTTEQAEAIQEEHLQQGNSVKDTAIKLGYIDEIGYLQKTAELLGTELIDLSQRQIPEHASSRLPGMIMKMHHAAPIDLQNNTAIIAVADWPSPATLDEISFALSCSVHTVVAKHDDIEQVLAQLYGNKKESNADLLAHLEADLKKEPDLTDPEHGANATPVIQFVNMVLHQAVKDKASDIHLEPFEHEFKIRYRVDGALYEMAPPPVSLALPIISRVKVVAGLDIAESRLPQDGRIQLNVADKTIDFRVSTLPTQFGESVVLRVLDRSNVQLEIDTIGFPDDIKKTFLEDIHKPNGIIVVTGPTGSGKTTTLYAALQQINRIENKILTAEDPVEYDVEGIVQLPIRDHIGLTFASALRSFLRQDPDIIMVGEIRDLETAQIAIQASLTGHLVFSTLHTNDAPGAVTRLIDMDVEPYLAASSLEAVMAQRLVRTICPACRSPYTPDLATLQLLELEKSEVGDMPFFKGTGCPACNNSGYSGRKALFEYMQITDPLRDLIINRQPAIAIRNKAIKLGMRTLREDGIRAILDGYTTIEEIIQYT